MKDELKIFTDQHRESFEQYSLDLDDTWKDIEEKLDQLDGKSYHFPWGNLLKVAAVIIVMFAVGIGFFINSQRISYNNNGIALHNISSDLADTEAFYSSQIEEKLKMIEVSQGNVDTEVNMQMEILDEEYKSLKNDLKDNADSEEVINAMIEYYRLKLGMLEKILEEVQKNDENKDYEEVQAI